MIVGVWSENKERKEEVRMERKGQMGNMQGAKYKSKGEEIRTQINKMEIREKGIEKIEMDQVQNQTFIFHPNKQNL